MRAKAHPQAPQLVAILFGAYRRQILALLLLRPDENFYVREIGRLTGVPAGSLHRELKLLSDAGLLLRSAADCVAIRGIGGGTFTKLLRVLFLHPSAFLLRPKDYPRRCISYSLGDDRRARCPA